MFSLEEDAQDGHEVALVLHDTATTFDDCVGQDGKSAKSTYGSIAASVGQDELRCFYSDSSKELKRSIADLKGVNHMQSTPYDPQNNSIIERVNKSAVEGARCAIYQSGLLPGLRIMQPGSS